jgi:hypothetical protein
MFIFGIIIGFVLGVIFEGTNWKYKVSEMLGIKPPGFGQTFVVDVKEVEVWEEKKGSACTGSIWSSTGVSAEK